MSRLPKILLFTPIYEGKDYCLEEFLEKTKQINYPNFRHIFIDNSKTEDYYNKLKGMGLDVFYVERGNNTREALARAQNFARNIAIKDNYDYLMSLESDIMIPPNIIQLLVRHGKDVVSALYMIGDRDKGMRVPCLTLSTFNKEIQAFGTRLLNPEEYPEYLHKGLKQVQAAGMGCCLIYKRVFNRVAFTYDPRFNGHSDIYFFNRMFELRVPVWVDTDILLDHKNSDWTKVKDR